MNAITISDLRGNLSTHLNKIKSQNKPLIFGERHKKEFLITTYPDLKNDIDLFEYNSIVEDKAIEKEYYRGIQNTMSDWFSDENEGLFE